MVDAAYAALVVAFGLWAVLDGYDFGVGVLHRLIARTEAERRTVFAAIGPYWDGNEVWLLAAAGVLFIAFPRALGSGLSGLYLGFFVGVWSLMGRGLSIELRSHLRDPLWRAFFDSLFQLSSLGVILVFGAALGAVLRGVPLDASGYFSVPLFASEGDTVGLFDPYTLLVALFVLVSLGAHGCMFLLWKTRGDLAVRARSWGVTLLAICAGFWLVTTWATSAVRPALLEAFPHRPVAWLAVVAAAAGLGLAGLGLQRRWELVPFIGSSLFVFAVLAAAAACQYPVLLPSTIDARWSLTVDNAALSASHLTRAAKWWLPGIALVGGYFFWVAKTFRGKAEPEKE